MKKYHYFYEIRNNINNHFYYGIHSTDDMEDGYMGSGKRLQRAYKKYGIENFTKTILKEFSTREEASVYEAEMVTETLVKDNNCYNCALGGDSVQPSFGQIAVFDKEEKISKRINVEEYRNNSSRYETFSKNKVNVFDKLTKKYTWVSSNEFYQNRDLYKTYREGKILCKNAKGEAFLVESTDERLLNNTLTIFCQGRKHKEESLSKMKETFKKIKHQQGEKNSQYGTCWVYNEQTKENKKIKKEELDEYVKNGYIKGRKVNY